MAHHDVKGIHRCEHHTVKRTCTRRILVWLLLYKQHFRAAFVYMMLDGDNTSFPQAVYSLQLRCMSCHGCVHAQATIESQAVCSVAWLACPQLRGCSNLTTYRAAKLAADEQARSQHDSRLRMWT